MIQDIKLKLIRSFKSGKLNIFFLFLALSFMFLLLTKLTREYTKTIVFNANPVHAKENYVILEDTTHKFDVTLRTNGFRLIKYYLSTPSIEVDLQDMDVVGNHYIWTKNKGISGINSQFNENIELIAVNPDSMSFQFDVNTIKTVPINLKSDVTFVPGYDVSGGLKLHPDSIKIIGPKVMIDTIHIIKTEEFKLENINTDIDSELNLVLPDSSESITYSHKKIKVTGHVEKFTEGEVEVPIDLVNAPKDAEVIYFPKTVNVTYYTSLGNYKNINKNDFIVECDFKDLDTNATYLQAKLVKYPEHIKNVRLVQKQIDFIITK